MRKKAILITIPLLIIAYFLTNAWITIFTDNHVIKWQHLAGVILFVPLPALVFINYKWAVLGTGIYLLLASFSIVSLTAPIIGGFIAFGAAEIKGFSWLGIGLFILYFFINLATLIELQLDYKDSKAHRKGRK